LNRQPIGQASGTFRVEAEGHTCDITLTAYRSAPFDQIVLNWPEVDPGLAHASDASLRQFFEEIPDEIWK